MFSYCENSLFVKLLLFPKLFLSIKLSLFMLIYLFLNDHASDIGADYEKHAGDGISDGKQGG